MPAQSAALSTAAPSTAALSTIVSGFNVTQDKNTESTFVWRVEEKVDCSELQIFVDYGGGTQTNNHVTPIHIPWGDFSLYQIGPGFNPEIKVEGVLKVVWGNYDQTAKKYMAFVIVFSGVMTLVGKGGILSGEKSSSKNWTIVYAHLA